MVCLGPRAPGDSVRPRRLSGVVVRPLNFTVRGRAKNRLCSESHKLEEPGQRPFVRRCWRARAHCAKFSARRLGVALADAAVAASSGSRGLR